ncbi:MAG: bifunctional riboflavin kinase/FAD synthetase [Firmicutes bacterium]|nr:bifunctional riboflavin kinase/FAD synthetase [Bacillota bacterium]
MVVFNSLEEIENIEPCCVALGNFDGVHVGHQSLIRRTVEKAKEHGLKSAVFTFSTHPKNLIPGRKPVKNIIYQDEKADLIEALGVDYLFNIEFTEEIMKTAPEAYIKDFLVDKFNAKEVFCGFNYHYGHKAAGDYALLEACGKKYGYTVNQIEPVIVDGDVVSSTLIRGLIKAGEMEDCQKYLGRVYDIGGEVVVGNRLGKKLGFPTSNIMLDESMVTPPNGVYVTYCLYNGVRYPSITNVGVKPTIGEFKKNMETHIFNFDKELYGKFIKIEFVKKTRDEVKFSNVEELSAQIEKDCNEARQYHGL